jgi:hypothetical protein
VENGARDDTEDWRLPARSGPPTVAELEARIDEAIAIARASEAAVVTVGAAAIESAEQAKWAAELAVRASEIASRVTATNGAAARTGRESVHHGDDPMLHFSRRADRLRARFALLQRR